MKARPILFSAPMVRALLAGQKTQTRRIVKPQPEWVIDGRPLIPKVIQVVRERRIVSLGGPEGGGGDRFCQPIRCPYGQPGDLLWCREGFSLQGAVDGDLPPYHDDRPTKWGSGEAEADWTQAHYRATDPPPDLCCEDKRCRTCGSEDGSHPGYGPHWKSPLFLPRWAARLWLELDSVRVERVQDISEEDAKAEGVPFYVYGHGPISEEELRFEHGYWSSGSYRAGVEYAWNRLHGPGAWERNPWVWVLQFHRVDRPDELAGGGR